MVKDEIIQFLIRAKQATYAGKGAETASTRPQSHDLFYQENDYMYYDTYLGGASFSGEEALWIGGAPYWSMNYAGRVIGNNFSSDFLKDALFHVTKEKPFRGPENYISGTYTYKCEVNGDFDWFQGYETICYKEEKIYECYFHGSRLK